MRCGAWCRLTLRERLEALPHRRKYLLLVHDLGNRLLQVQRDWLEDVEAALRPSEPSR